MRIRNPTLRLAINVIRGGLRYARPTHRAAMREQKLKRQRVDRELKNLCGIPANKFDGAVLIDGQWDNPNYWLRTSLVRAAVGLPNGREVGLLGQYLRRECSQTMNDLGIEVRQAHDQIPVDADEVAREADRLQSITRDAYDILAWDLPGGVPGAILYDGILKRQRLASVDVRRSDFRPLLIEGLKGIARAQRLLSDHDFRLVIISHPFGFICGPIAHQALARGIPVILPFGLFGVVRMTHMHQPDDLTAFYDRPTREEMDELPRARAERLQEAGRLYLARRFEGCADDLASVYAFQKRSGDIDRIGICRRFGWNPDKPIVGFYASNWYDWPHQLGMTQFRDFLDWTEATFQAATENSSVNWLFKPHPCEEWFGGVALEDILSRLNGPAHIGIADKDWNNTAVMQALNSLVTYHGTAGIEFASLGKPVLVPDRGKYEDCGFVKVASDRANYLSLLRQDWWKEMDLEECKRRAEIFAGWWFCAPGWQEHFILPDDSRQNAIYDIIPSLLSDHRDEVQREISQLREWIASGHRYSHTYKMMHADTYRLTNV